MDRVILNRKDCHGKHCADRTLSREIKELCANGYCPEAGVRPVRPKAPTLKYSRAPLRPGRSRHALHRGTWGRLPPRAAPRAPVRVRGEWSPLSTWDLFTHKVTCHVNHASRRDVLLCPVCLCAVRCSPARGAAPDTHTLARTRVCGDDETLLLTLAVCVASDQPNRLVSIRPKKAHTEQMPPWKPKTLTASANSVPSPVSSA